jgi:hypothetical protein
MAHVHNRRVIHSRKRAQPVEALLHPYKPAHKLWINLWKLWIAVGIVDVARNGGRRRIPGPPVAGDRLVR